MNEMYKYLKEHSYISQNKKSNYQFELSSERAECIANKYDSLTDELQQENKQLKEKIKKTIRMLEIQIEVIKAQPSDNALNDNMEIKQREMVINLLNGASE